MLAGRRRPLRRAMEIHRCRPTSSPFLCRSLRLGGAAGLRRGQQWRKAVAAVVGEVGPSVATEDPMRCSVIGQRCLLRHVVGANPDAGALDDGVPNLCRQPPVRVPVHAGDLRRAGFSPSSSPSVCGCSGKGSHSSLEAARGRAPIDWRGEVRWFRHLPRLIWCFLPHPAHESATAPTGSCEEAAFLAMMCTTCSTKGLLRARRLKALKSGWEAPGSASSHVDAFHGAAAPISIAG